MTSIKMLRFFQAVSYLVVVAQLLFYLVILADAFKLVSIESFLEIRKVIDVEYGLRFKIIYYTALLLTLTLVLTTVKSPGSAAFITSLIAFICLVADVAIAMKGNIPINNQINSLAAGNASVDWEELRSQWLMFIRCRGVLSVTGMLSLLIGLILDK